jgi:mono/diheme cytochrome c family protein
MKIIKFKFTFFFVSAFTLLSPTHAENLQNDTFSDIVYLNQAWSKNDRDTFYWQPQGSALLSYDIYLALTLPDSSERFNSRTNADRVGLLVDPTPNSKNPDNLPIGVAKSVVTQGDLKGAYAGLTCAACHTNQLQYQGKQIRIDGGTANRFDVLLWLQTLSKSIDEPLNNPASFQSLLKRIKETGPVDEIDLRARLKVDAEFIRLQLTQSFVVPFAPGPGRTDAFAEEINTVNAIHTGIFVNSRPALAPVKPPFLWNASQSAWVEWSGIAANPFIRNYSEALGVFARYDLTSPNINLNETSTTINIKNIIGIEQLLRRLAPPAWPEKIFGKLDQARVKEGSKLFEKYCVECHTTYPYRWSAKRASGKRMIENALVPQEIIGTDNQHLLGIIFDANPTMLTRQLAKYVRGKTAVSSEALFTAIELPLMARDLKAAGPFTELEILDMNGYINESVSLKIPINSYKASPRDGAWSTAPFLHNGSIPNLYELLSPLNQRSKTFYNTREFDPVKLGLDIRNSYSGYLFDTTLIGNSNSGHLFENGTGKGIIGPELSVDERFAIIEYMKSIPETPGRITPYGGPDKPILADNDDTWFNFKHPYGSK